MALAPVLRTELHPDVIMCREALGGSSSRGFTNVTVFWPLRFLEGSFNEEICRETLSILTQRHPNLQTAFCVKGAVVQRLQLESAFVPLTYYYEEDPVGQWKKVVKKELRQPFNDPDNPGWRAAVVLGHEHTILVALTIFHALGDGVCLGHLAVQFNEVMAHLMKKEVPPPFPPETSPPLTLLYEKFPEEISLESAPLEPLQHHLCATGFAKRALTQSADLVCAMKKYSKDHQILMHSMLVAALVLAVKEVKTPIGGTFQALSIVSFRKLLGVSNKLIRPLFSWLAVDDVDPEQDFLAIAHDVHTRLHAQLDQGVHVANLKRTEAALQKNPTAEEFVKGLQIAPNLINVTNRQILETTGIYPKKDPVLEMSEIYGVGGTDPYLGLQGPGGVGITIGVTTLKTLKGETLMCTASTLEDPDLGLGEEKAAYVLKRIEEILLEATRLK